MKTQEITTKDKIPTKYNWKGNKKQLQAMENWIDPGSETFGNAYQSWLKAGFSNSYSKNIMNIAPKYLSEFIDRMDLSQEHIKQGIQNIATTTFSEKDSRSPADTRLKAYELLAKIIGILDSKQTTNVTLVQPILSGESVKQDNKQATTDNKEETTHTTPPIVEAELVD
jgi:hypothetical protein